MSIQINPDQVAMQELAARGVDASVGVFGNHYVQIGKASPIRLDEIKSADVPFAWFKTATQIRRGKEGVRQTAEDAIKVLLKPGALDAGTLLGLLKAGQTHLAGSRRSASSPRLRSRTARGSSPGRCRTFRTRSWRRSTRHFLRLRWTSFRLRSSAKGR